MYESPITIIRPMLNDMSIEINRQTDEAIFREVVRFVPEVNKEELIKALEYDRGQYLKGYYDRDDEIIRCKDCKRNNDGNLCDIAYYINEDGDGFCNCGERREE